MLCMRVTKQVLCHDVGYLPVGTIIHVEDSLQPILDRWVALGYAVQVGERAEAEEPPARHSRRAKPDKDASDEATNE